MAKYLILIYGDEQQWAAETEQERQSKGDAHRAFAVAAGERLLGGGELQPPELATTLRGRDEAAHLTVTDGPFLETKEGVGGYYLLDVPDLDEAIRLAGMLPELTASHCSVEIRPLVAR